MGWAIIIRSSRTGGALPILIIVLIALWLFYWTAYNLFLTIIISNEASARKHRVSGGDDINSIVKRPPERLFHVAMTATDQIYMQWQSRIMYYWYMKHKNLPGSEMGGFTRILHSGKPDLLMDEIPTSVVDPLPAGVDLGYIVLHRPWAYMQWLEYTIIPEEYILMAEPDHLFLRPLPNLAQGTDPVGYPFFYIKPKKHERIMRRFYPNGPLSNIYPIGNSPVIIKKDLLEKIVPTWLNVSIRIKYDSEASQKIGWVQEMYGYAIAAAHLGIHHVLREDLMLQPPWDLNVGKSFILHYTYRCDYNEKGVLTYGKSSAWGFNKKTYLYDWLPKNLTLPPQGVPETVVVLIKMINEASANLPNWNGEILK